MQLYLLQNILEIKFQYFREKIYIDFNDFFKSFNMLRAKYTQAILRFGLDSKKKVKTANIKF